MHQLVLEDALEGFQPGGALDAANGNPAIGFPKAVKQHGAGDRDFETHFPRTGLDPERLASRFCHPGRRTKCKPAPVEHPSDQTVEKLFIVSVEKKVEIAGI